jgi:hypothetical protein
MVKFGFFTSIVLFLFSRMKEQRSKRRNFVFLAFFEYLECLQKNVEGLEKIRVLLLEI